MGTGRVEYRWLSDSVWASCHTGKSGAPPEPICRMCHASGNTSRRRGKSLPIIARRKAGARRQRSSGGPPARYPRTPDRDASAPDAGLPETDGGIDADALEEAHVRKCKAAETKTAKLMRRSTGHGQRRPRKGTDRVHFRAGVPDPDLLHRLHRASDRAHGDGSK
jgi:hypothetical protein